MAPGKLRCPRVGLVILTALLMLFILRSELHGVQGCDVQTCGKHMTVRLLGLPTLLGPCCRALSGKVWIRSHCLAWLSGSH